MSQLDPRPPAGGADAPEGVPPVPKPSDAPGTPGSAPTSAAPPPRDPGTPSSLDADIERELAEALGDGDVDQLMEEAARAAGAGDTALAEDPSARAAAPEGGEAGDAGASGGTAPGGAPGGGRIEHELKRGRISAIRGDDVFVEVAGVAGKNSGVVPLKQFDRPPRIGSIMDFVAERFDEAEGLWALSREGAITRTTWDHLQRGSLVEARVVSTNKGGLELEMVGGIRAFMPASQIEFHHTTDLEQYVGQKLHAAVQEIDRKGKKVVISRRGFLEQEKQAKRGKTLAELEVGQVRDGTVTSLMEYGAFVDLGGVDGLVHVSDLSYKHVNRPADVIKAGQAVKVKVLKLDKEKGRISLGLKQVEPDPWEGLAERIKPGEEISGRVVRTADFGAFVEVEPGVEGLLPASELTWKRGVRAADVTKEGDVLRLRVLQVDPAKRRISLSLKQSQGDPWIGAERKYAAHALVDATVLTLTDFGAFVELEPGVEGLIHISELSDRRVNAVGDVVKPGDRHQLRVLDVDETNRRIRLSLKAVKEPPPQAAPVAAGKAAATAAPAKPGKPAPKKPTKPLKGGMDVGGIGLGNLRL